MIASFLSSALVFAGVVCENGVCRLVPDEPVVEQEAAVAQPGVSLPEPDRMAQGYMGEDEFMRFLTQADAQERVLPGAFLLILVLAVLGGLALNLTPCVLPMIPVNLLVIGASPLRGLLYGLGQMTAFGALGLLAALGGVAFGTIQASPWFNGAVALLLFAFALSLFGVFSLDFTRFRKGLKGGAFLIGAFSAVLAGACVAPILASVLLLTARLYAEGRPIGLLLPFAVGLGLALPWPFLGAGLKVLPKPGAWMRWVNRMFGLLLILPAVHYALVAFHDAGESKIPGARDQTVEEFRASPLLTGRRDRPLLVYCHASWCKNCSAMERLLTSSPRIRGELARMDVVRLDAEDPNALARLPGMDRIKGLPAFVLYLPSANMVK